MSDEFPTQPLRAEFLRACDSWIGDGYSLDLRYVARRQGDSLVLYHAVLRLNSFPKSADFGLELPFGSLQAGQIQIDHAPRAELLELIYGASRGRISCSGLELCLPIEGSPYFQVESGISDRWYAVLDLKLLGETFSPVDHAERAALDDILRSSYIPFDGCEDLMGWLALELPQSGGTRAKLEIFVSPPADLNVNKSELRDSNLALVLVAHESLDLDRVALAVRAVPGPGLAARSQIVEQISWSAPNKGHRVGKVDVSVPEADSCLTMLVVGGRTVRRQWFVDPMKAPNPRFVAISHFDNDLKMIRQALQESHDAAKFEQAVAALLFLSGLSPCVQLEKDSPDLIVATGVGRLAVVECTLRVSDVAAKIGKLVHRRGELSKTLRQTKHIADVAAILVCRLPRDEIAANTELLNSNNVILISGGDFDEWLVRARSLRDSDEVLTELAGPPRFDA